MTTVLPTTIVQTPTVTYTNSAQVSSALDLVILSAIDTLLQPTTVATTTEVYTTEEETTTVFVTTCPVTTTQTLNGTTLTSIYSTTSTVSEVQTSTYVGA